MDNFFKNKVEFSIEEQKVIELLKDGNFYYNPGEKAHKQLKPAIANMFFRGLIDRGDKAINHYVLNDLCKKAIEWNNAVEFFNS